MNRSIKTAIYTGSVPSTTFIERLIQGLAENGLHIYLFGFQNKKIAPAKNTYYITYTNKLSKLILLIKYSLLLAFFKAKDKRKLDKIISNKNKNAVQLKIKYYPVLYHCPDIFHLQWAKGIEDWMWVQDFGMKLVVSLRGAHINYSPISDSKIANTYKSFFPKVAGFHAVSNTISIEAQKYSAQLHKIQIIYSGLDLNKLPFQLKKFDANAMLRIVSVGRDHWKKGYIYALNSIKLLKDVGIDIHYTIIGVGTSEELLYQRFKLGLEKEVTFIDKLPFEKVLKEMGSADVLLLSSVEEGIANVVLEAMTVGTLVVSTNCGGMNEVVRDNENGFLIPIRDAVSISSALQKVANLPIEDYQKITKEARRTIEKQHTHEKMVMEMQAFYHKVLNSEL